MGEWARQRYWSILKIKYAMQTINDEQRDTNMIFNNLYMKSCPIFVALCPYTVGIGSSSSWYGQDV